MKLSDFGKVTMLVNLVKELNNDRIRAADQESDYLGVTIQGRYQKEDIVNSARPAIVEKIDASIAAAHDALRELGVEIDV